MRAKNIQSFYDRFNATRVNVRQSSGAINKEKNVAIFQVWVDQFEKDWVKVMGADWNPAHFGVKERKEMIQHVVENDTKVILVVAKAKDVDVQPRSIESFNNRSFFIGGAIEFRENGDTFIKVIGREDLSFAETYSPSSKRGFTQRA